MVRIIVVTLAALGALTSCRSRQTGADTVLVGSWTPRGPIIEALRDTGCAYFKSYAHSSPDSLLDEFLARAGRGEFDHTEPWLPQAVDCIGAKPGYDSFLIVGTYSVARLDSVADTVRYVLTMHAIGSHISSFEPGPSVAYDTVTLWRSSYGWRIRSPAPWPWMLARNAVRRGLLKPADTIPARSR